MSDSEHSYYTDASDDESHIASDIHSFLKKKPVYIRNSKGMSSSNINQLRSKLDRLTTNPAAVRDTRSKCDDKRKAEDLCKILQNELIGISSKLNSFGDIIRSLFDQFEKMEERFKKLDELEKDLTQLKTKMEEVEKTSMAEKTYANAAASVGTNINSNTDRLAKLEYKASEEERKKRNLQVTLTHPSIDTQSTDLDLNIRGFLASYLKMNSREIDTAMIVKKSTRNYTINIFFSDLRFKKYLFAARKKLRTENPEATEGLFLNENLTSFNFGLLKKLKSERLKENSHIQKTSRLYIHMMVKFT